jgi:hypothetical protein
MGLDGPDRGFPSFSARPGGDGRVIAAALLAGIAAFAFRILALRGLPNDHYMHLAWAQQVLFSDIPGRDFVDPGMPLVYILSALVQRIWAGPFADALLTAGMLAIAASTTVMLVSRVTTLWIGLAAALFQVALVPRLYSYPKILVPAVALLIFHRYATAPGLGRMMQLSVWTGFAILLRRDLGLITALGCATGLTALFASDARRAASAVATYAGGVLVSLAPYLIFLAATAGLVESVRESVEFAKSDAHQFLATVPAFSFLGETGFHWSWTQTDAAAVLSYASYLVAALSWVALYIARPSTDRQSAWTTMAVGTIFLSLYVLTILRHPLVARVPDMAAVLPILSGWLMWVLFRAGRRVLTVDRPAGLAAMAGATVVGVALVTMMAASVWTLGNLREKVRDTGVFGGVRNVATHIRSLALAGSQWPWPRFWPAGELPSVVPYLNSCTDPSDRVLLTWAAPEYYFFARRPFGGGHAWLLPTGYRSTRDQELMIERLVKHRVPVALINETTRAQFVDAYPRVDAYLRMAYRSAGRFRHRDGSDITIAVRDDLQPLGAFGPEGWPCGFRTVS